MAPRFGSRSTSAILLVALVIVIAVFGIPARYGLALATGLSLAQLALIGGAATRLIAPAWRTGRDDRRRLAITGLLLIAPWALLTLLPGYGPPFAADLAMNHVRYVVLFVAAAFLGAGFLMFKEPLSDGGDDLLAPLGQAAGLLGTVIQLIWAALLIGWTMSEAHKPAIYLPLYGTPLGNASDVLLFFAGILTYLATALYALSLVRLGWLGRRKGLAMTTVATLAVVGLILRGLQYPDLAENWYTTPGMVVGIPAIPWLLPYLLGVLAMFRAAEPIERSSDQRR